ncbi:putative disulfide isomerase [Aspergillus vadensis CBS 113365]|uniref:protein disulfide-isomerase n=1 Tax=Aspergillus vadensis (strain CBS 113365 / IMI 142717 / IBT 24658) TaxID=1448311 RepID=A0A319B155_ASPVC|nr:PDI related protein A [Aspergillus vadensis CBS 113365]PYH65544.1 PDI related protein A [Aspergillus vadensis CBS 113365]
MLQPSSALLFVTSLLAALPVNADGLYTKKSPVLQVNQKNYDQLIANSNHTSIVEFYAPWCGHCQNLKPAYEKAATNLDGLAKVAAVNCDDDDNKPFCGRMGVQGFPTLKIVTPGKKPGKPRVEDYKGARSAKAIVEAVVDRIPNHVKRATDKDLNTWLAQDEESPKAILFTEKGTTSPLLRALAIDFLGSIQVAQVRNKETEAVEKFGITEFPTFVLLPGNGQDPIVYDGELKKKPMVEFLSQAAAPNPDPAPKSSTAPRDNNKRKSTESAPEPKVAQDDDTKPASVPIPAPPIDTLPTAEALEAACLMPKSGTCVLALLPEPSEPDADLPAPAKDALLSLAEISHKHAVRKSKLFPFYSVPAINSGAKTLRAGLGLPEDNSVEIVALNGRRGWWRRYDSVEGAEYGQERVEAWIDAIRLGEGEKQKLPEGVVVEEVVEEKVEEKVEEVVEEPVEEKPAVDHDEL